MPNPAQPQPSLAARVAHEFAEWVLWLLLGLVAFTPVWLDILIQGGN